MVTVPPTVRTELSHKEEASLQRLSCQHAHWRENVRDHSPQGPARFFNTMQESDLGLATWLSQSATLSFKKQPVNQAKQNDSLVLAEE